MPTPNYNFPTITGSDAIDLVKAINDPLTAIDSTIKALSDRIDQLSGKTYTKGTTYDELKNNGFVYEDASERAAKSAVDAVNVKTVRELKEF